MNQLSPPPKGRLSIRLSTHEDVDTLAPILSRADLQSLTASGSPSPQVALLSGLNSPDACLTAIDELGAPLMMFGTVPHPNDPSVGLVWLLGSIKARHYHEDVLYQTKRYLGIFARKYRILMNFTDCRNKAQHKWLRQCGFKFLKKVTGIGPGRHPFYEVAIVRHDHV